MQKKIEHWTEKKMQKKSQTTNAKQCLLQCLPVGPPGVERMPGVAGVAMSLNQHEKICASNENDWTFGESEEEARKLHTGSAIVVQIRALVC